VAGAPVVEVCAWTGTTCAAAPIARFTTAPRGTDLPLTVNAAAGTYEAGWNLNNAAFTTRRTYRVRVLQGATELGAVSVDVVRGRWAVSRTDGTLAPLLSASALPVRFTIRPSTADSTLFRNYVAVAATGDVEIPYVVGGLDGSVHSVIAGAGPWGVGGALLQLPTGRTFLVYAGSDGLPERVVVNGVVLRFSNYTETTVDVSVTGIDGTVEMRRGAALPAIFAQLRNEVARSRTPGTSALRARGQLIAADASSNLAWLVKYSSLLVNTAGCTAAPLGFAALGPVGIAITAANCGLTLYSLLNFLEGKEDNDLAKSVGAILSIKDFQVCRDKGRVSDCVSALVGLADAALDRIQSVQTWTLLAFGVDDDVIVYLNSIPIYVDANRLASQIPAISFSARPGDQLQVVASDASPSACYGLTALVLRRDRDGSTFQISPGVPDFCRGPTRVTTFFNRTFSLPAPQ
jgi:hypothetical protein